MSFDDSPGGSITETGGGNATIAGPVLINGFIRATGAITVSDGTVTVPSFTIPAMAVTLFLGSYSIDAASGALTPAPGASALVSNVSTFPCGGTIRADDLLLDYRSSRPELANTAFRNISLSANGLGSDGAQFYTTASECAAPDGDSMVFEIGSVSSTTGFIDYRDLRSARASIGLLKVGGARLLSSGVVNISGFNFGFYADTDSIDFAPPTTFLASGGFLAGGRVSLGGDVSGLELDNFMVPTSGPITATGGYIMTEGMVSRFFDVTFNASSVSLGTLSIYPGGDIASATAENFQITGSRTNPVVSSPGGNLDVRGVRFLFQTATMGAQGFEASNATIENTSRFDETFLAVRLTRFGMSASSLFYFATLPYRINSVTARQPEGLTFNGFLDAPTNLFGIGLPGSFDAYGDQVRLTEIEFCSNGDGTRIKRSMFALPQFCFTYELGPPEVMTSFAEVTIPGVTGFGAGLRIFEGMLDRITVSLRNLEIPIGTTGTKLQDLIATVENLARVEREYIITETVNSPGNPPVLQRRTVRGVPPVRFIGDVSITGGPRILGKALARGDGAVILDDTQMNVDGKVTVVIFEVGGAYIRVVWSGQSRGTAFGGFMVYYSILRGNIDGFIGFDEDFSVCAGLALQVPDQIPIIGGIKLGSANVCIGAPPFTIAGTVKITIIPRICLGFLGCTPEVAIRVGFKIDENGDFELDRKARGERFAEWEVPYFRGYPVYAPSTDGDPKSKGEFVGNMVFFTNFHQTDKAYRSEGAFKAGPAKTETTQLFVNSGAPVIIRLTYENADGNPDFSLMAPDDQVYSSAYGLADIPAVPVEGQAVPSVVFVANPASRDASFMVPEPLEGIYTVDVLNPETLGQYAVEVLSEIPPPVFEFGFNFYATDYIYAEWTDEDPDTNANRIRIFIDTDSEGANGLLVGETGGGRPYGNIPDYENRVRVDSADVHLAAGYYWLYAIVEDGYNPPLVVYARSAIFIPDVEAPPAVMNLNAVCLNGTAIVTWEPVDDPTVVSYKVEWTDRPESGLYTYGTSVAADQSAAFIEGLRVGGRYKFTVTAVRYAEMSSARSAQKREVLANAVEKALAAKDIGTNNRHKRTAFASTFIESAAKTKGIQLTKAEALSLAQQTAELSSPMMRELNRAATPGAKADPPGFLSDIKQTVEFDYADSYRAQSDTLMVTAVPGQGPPVFVKEPVTSVFEGDLYSFEALAESARGSQVTYSKVSGPEGLTVSPAGLVSWQTAPGDAEIYEVEIAATDSSGIEGRQFWRVSVSQLRPNAGIRILPPQSLEVVPGETFTYQPQVEGLFRVPGLEDQEFINFQVISSVLGLRFDSDTGLTSWPTTMDDVGSHRMIVLVSQRIGDQRIEARQEIEVNVESVSDVPVRIDELNVPGNWWLLQ
ncbi:MAG: putative Ig domain-containing protein [Sumerlaeia bacterium]